MAAPNIASLCFRKRRHASPSRVRGLPEMPNCSCWIVVADDRCAGIHGAISFRRHTSLPSCSAAWIKHAVQDVRDQIEGHCQECEDEGQRHNHRCVGAIDRGDQYWPRPFTRNRFSVMIAPAKIVGISAIRVITGIRLFTRTCRTTTTRSVRPFARAVRT